MESTQKKTNATEKETRTEEVAQKKAPVKEETEMIKILPSAANGNTEIYINVNGKEKYIPVGEPFAVTKAEKKILERAMYI